MEELRGDDPRRVGGYRLLGRLGYGTGGHRTYLGRSEHGRRAALEVFHALHDEAAQRAAFRSALRKEVTAARRLTGRWTVPVLDADPEADPPWVATAYRAGPALSHLELGAPLPASSLRPLAHGLAGALRELRDAGLPYRPLTPSRVLLTPDGPRVLPALGHARPGPGGSGAPGGLSSPSARRQDGPDGPGVSESEAVRSLGEVLHYAATGRPPHREVSARINGTAQGDGTAAAASAGSSPPTGLPGLADGVPVDRAPAPDRALAELVEQCVAADPARRPTLDRIAELTAPGTAGEPWLPAALLRRIAAYDADDLPPATPGPGSPGAGPPTGTHLDPDSAGAARPRTAPADRAPGSGGTGRSQTGAGAGDEAVTGGPRPGGPASWPRTVVVVLAVIALLASLFAVLTLLVGRSTPEGPNVPLPPSAPPADPPT